MARVKRPKSKAKLTYYQTVPSAPPDKIASKPPIQNASLGNETPKGVPTMPARTGALGRRHGVPVPSGSSGIKIAAVKAPKLRVSGHPGAHHIGKR